MTKVFNLVLIIFVLGIYCVPGTFAQTTEISYQGTLKDGSAPANGNYDIEFRLFGGASGGTQIGTEIFLSPVQVVDGVFSVKLDFGPNGFPGADRYLEIAVRRTGAGSLVTLGPRQKISSAPYAIQSLQASTATTAMVAANAQALGGVNASQYVLTTDPRMTDPRSPLGGSTNYIQNTNTQQANSNFNIAGAGRAAVLSASNRFNFGTEHILSALGTDNLFAGSNSGLLNTTGNNNAFFGAKAGQENKGGRENSFFGAYAGQNNIGGIGNSFFGYYAGNLTTSGSENSFFGNRAGQVNTSGALNSFFGTFSGFYNSTGSDNSFFGNSAGYSNQGGNRNSFFGSQSGYHNSGDDNAFLGSFSGTSNTTGYNNSFVGSNSGLSNTTGFNNSFVGSRAGQDNNASNNSFFGTEAGRFNTTGANNTFLGRNSGHDNTTGELNVFIGVNAGSGNQLGRFNTVVGAEANVLGTNLTYATAIGAESIVNASNTIALGRPTGADTVRVPGALTVGGNLNVTGTLTAQNLSVQATNITGVIPTANGGTGLSAPGTAGRFLRSDGTNWISAPLLASELPSGSTSYVQNSTTQQGSANFNISGNGTAGGTLWGNAVNSSTQYNIGGSRVLIANGSNMFAGLSAGGLNTTGSSNTFAGNGSGAANTSGNGNSFFGTNAGFNSSGGSNNTFSGSSAGSGNTSGGNNSFFGVNAGQTNTAGANNTVIGANANVGSNNLSFATAIGADAVVSTNNTVVLGRSLDSVRVPGNFQVDGNLIANGFQVQASNITGTVAVANGGTGMNASGASGNFLRSNGSIWLSSPIAPGDIPAGSTSYIQNGSGLQAGASFNVGGNGAIAGNLTVGGTISGNFTNIPSTSITGLIGAQQGGTGLNGSTGTNFLRGNGTGGWTSAALTASDLPAGSTSYVQNTTTAQPGVNFNIGGNGTIGGSLTVNGAINGSVSANNISGVLGVSHGGTGLSSVGTSGHFLKSTGTGFATSALTFLDIPDLSSGYVQNNPASVQVGGFSVSGNGSIGTNLQVGGNGTFGGSLTVTGAINGSVSASNISGTLGVAQGGTGLSSVGTSGHFLKSTGTGFATSALTLLDIPDLSAGYIQNNPSSAQVGGFSVSGNGSVGNNLQVGGNGTFGGNVNITGGLTVNGTFSGSFNVPATNVSGVLDATRGGTGLGTSSGNLFLRGNGSGGWTTGGLTSADIPSLGGTYIQNSTNVQASSDFNVSGTGRVGTTMTVGTTLTANTVDSSTQYNIGGNRVLSTSGTNNVFVGDGTGTTGSSNSFIGKDAGNANTVGSGNTIIGANADVASGNLTNATAIGANATVSASNAVVIGSVSGENGGSDTQVGIGVSAPKAKLDVRGGNIYVGSPGQGIILRPATGTTCTLLVADGAGGLTPSAITCP